MTLKSFLAGAAMAVLSVTGASAVTIDGFVPELGIDYHFLDFAGGTLSIDAPAQPGSLLDSMSIEFALFEDNGSSIGGLTGSLITIQTVGGFTFAPGNSFSGAVAAGSYVLAVGVNQLAVGEARSGVASTPNADDSIPSPYSIIYGSGVTVTSVVDSTGQVDDLAIAPVALPASLPLLAFAAGGLGYLGRRRRKAHAQTA